MRSPIILPFTALSLLSVLTPANATAYTFSELIIPGEYPDSFMGSVAAGINNKGQVVGNDAMSATNQQGYILDLTTGTSSVLTSPASSGRLLASKINDAGEVLGNDAIGSGFETTTGPGFLLDTNTDAISAAPSGAESLNDIGQFVGTLSTAGRGNLSPTSHGFLLDTRANTQVIIADPLAPTQTSAFDLNDHGQAVGTYVVNTINNGFLFDNSTGSYTTINDPLGTSTLAIAINNVGQVVGFVFSTSNANGSSSFVLDLATDTYTNLTFPGAAYTFAQSINDAGQIVGFYRNGTDIAAHAFIATPQSSIDPLPMPEPASMTLLSSALLALGLGRRRQCPAKR